MGQVGEHPSSYARLFKDNVPGPQISRRPRSISADRRPASGSEEEQLFDECVIAGAA